MPDSFSLNSPIMKVLTPAFVILIVYLVCRLKRISAEQLLLKPPVVGPATIWSLIYIAYMLVSDFFLNWRGEFDFSVWRQQSFAVSAARIVGVGVLGPISEELVFRGLIFFQLSKLIKNRWLVGVIIAIGWALLHYDYDLKVIIIIMVEGIILAAAMIKSRSIYVPMILHIIWNLYAVW